MAGNFASALASMLPSLTSIAGNWGGGTDIGSSLDLMQAQTTHWRNNTQWYNDNILAHAYKNTRNSLQEAGYNPLMALSNGALYDQGAMPNATAQSSAKGISMNQLTKSQVANVNADTMLKGAETERANSSASLMNQQRETEIHKTRIEELREQEQDLINKIREKEYTQMDIKLLNETRQAIAMEQQAFAAIGQSEAAKTNSSANMINATQGNIHKYIIDKIEKNGSNAKKIYGGLFNSQVTDYVKKNRKKATEHRLKYGY